MTDEVRETPRARVMREQAEIEAQRRIRLGQPSELSTARRKLWCDVWVAMAQSAPCRRPKIACDWANAAVKDFDERFRPVVLVEQEEKTSK